MARAALVIWDLVMSFMWVWAGALSKLLVSKAISPSHQYHHPVAIDILKASLTIAYMFFFAWLGSFTRGASYNPLTVLSSAFSGSIPSFFFTAFARIPAQVIGAIIGVKLIKEAFPQIGHGPRLNVGIHHGALTEGLLTLLIVIISLSLKKKVPNSSFMNTWISSMSKVTLHILGSDLTGGIMNPASAFGWAYARGDHITMEHLFVYWIAPIQATILGVLLFNLFVGTKKHNEQGDEHKKAKSD